MPKKITNSNQQKTPELLIEFYSLSNAAKIANCEQSDLLYAGTHGRLKILVGVPPGYELLLEEKSDFFNLAPQELGIPHQWCCPKLLVLSKNHCHDLEISGAALLGNARYGYSINHSHQLTGIKLPWESDERLTISKICNGDFDERQIWSHWYIHKVGSDAELEVSLANLWIAKTQVDKFLGSIQDNPCDEKDEYKSDPFYIKRRDRNPFSPSNVSKFIQNGEKPPPDIDLYDYSIKELIKHYKIHGRSHRRRPNNVAEIYQSDMLGRMNQAAFYFWGCSQKNKKTESEEYKKEYKKEYKLPCWNNEEIVNHFMNLELDIPFNKKLANAATTIIRPEYASKGRHPEALDELDEVYLQNLEKLKNYHKSNNLKYLNQIALDFWCHPGVFEKDSATYPDERVLLQLLLAKGFSESLAIMAIFLIRPNFAKKLLLAKKKLPKAKALDQVKGEEL